MPAELVLVIASLAKSYTDPLRGLTDAIDVDYADVSLVTGRHTSHAIHINVKDCKSISLIITMLPGNPLPQGMVSPPVDCGWVVGCCCYKRSLAYARRRHIQQAHPKQAKFVPRCFPHPELQIANKQADPKRSAGLDVPQV